MTCGYCKDEFCVNDKCPMCADYCPVYDTPNVCKYDTRNVECNFYDKCETYENCTVQVLTNSATGECSVGWKRNRKDDDK